MYRLNTVLRHSKRSGIFRASAQWSLLSNSYNTSATHKKVILQLLKTIGAQEDVEEYLKNFGTPGTQKVAVIKVGGEVLINELELFAKSVTFLKLAGLFPVIIHGAGPQMNDALAKAQVEPSYIGGMRVTDASTLAVARRVFLDANMTLVRALESVGTRARPITSGVFEAQMKDFQSLGYVGETKHVNSAQIHEAVKDGYVPVLTSMGESSSGQLLNINADVAARELSIDLQPYKTIFINAKGGWIEDDGKKLEVINMKEDYHKMASRDYTGRQGTLLKLNEIKLLLDHLPRSSSVALTSSKELHREILSKSSAGTICVHGGDAHADASAWISGEESSKFKVGLLGARGFVGREVIRYIGQHPQLTLHCASSRALKGLKVLDSAISPPLNPHTNEPAITTDPVRLHIDPDLEFIDLGLSEIENSSVASDLDVWILALPNGLGHKYVLPLLNAAKRNGKEPLLIDLSSDYRFDESGSWVYGLPELPGARDRIRTARLIANPGCYASGAQLGLLPLVDGKAANIELDTRVTPHIFGVSGYSGAGTGLSPKNNPKVLQDNLLPYSLVNHIHEREISRHIGVPVAFMPHVAPFFQGISLTLSAKLKNPSSVTLEKIRDHYKAYYENERLVQVVDGIPEVKSVAGTRNVVIGGMHYDEASGRVAAVSTIDNLLKGAATVAIQNMNLALGLDELEGLK